MIVVKLMAGLGNQMFQYALGRRLSLDWRDELKFDSSWFNNIQSGETPRDLEVDKFNVNLIEASPEEIKRARGGFLRGKFFDFVKKIKGRLDRNYFYSFHPALLKKRKNIYLDGYFQSYKFIDSAREELLKDFVLKNDYSVPGLEIMNEISGAGQSVAAHVRRGDFATSCKNWNGLCDVTYYEKALAEIAKKHDNIKIFVFSDDIEWAKENLKFNFPTIFVSRPELSGVEELLLMSKCQHQIIANSTFSWWAAWLNQNPEKIIIAPKRWLLVADIDTKDLLPPDWLRI